MSPQITRMSGAGNTFLVWDAVRWPLPKEARTGITRLMCDGFTGFFTDGMVFIDADSSKQSDFAWDFYNSDGSTAEMCGNAARCAALFFNHKMNGGSELSFLTTAGRIGAKILEDQVVEIRMPPVSKPGEFLDFKILGKAQEHFFINTGVPHVVVEASPDEALAKALRQAPEVGEAGANVTFFNEVSPGEVEAVTFERGVENFTLACGTGAVAAAALSLAKNPLLKKHSISMPGGTLEVTWLSNTQAILTGPAQFEFEISFPEGLP